MEEKLNNFYELFSRRKSVREYSDKEIEEEKLNRIFETLRRAQSAANCQPWHFIVLKKEGREEFNQLLKHEGFKKAPVIIAACAEPKKAWIRRYDNVNYAWVDVAIAITEMIAATTAEGLGTCWVASFDPDKARKILSIPPSMEIVALIPMGYPKTPLVREEKDRKKLEEILHYDKW